MNKQLIKFYNENKKLVIIFSFIIILSIIFLYYWNSKIILSCETQKSPNGHHGELVLKIYKFREKVIVVENVWNYEYVNKRFDNWVDSVYKTNEFIRWGRHLNTGLESYYILNRITGTLENYPFSYSCLESNKKF